ncbi:hypothetical protein VNI00_005160 [Paramarasmius palmivorus]|uniref:PLP-dependent transferase n=1 Tax=Paramarasmius palmivorus TaxID=297713 RepID=A0AAW0DIM8_9AGAR
MPLHTTLFPQLLNKDEWQSKTSQQKYNTMGSWFLGPRGENAEIMKQKLSSIIDHIVQGRTQNFPDPAFVTSDVTNSQEFKDSITALQVNLDSLADRLAENHVPFYSPRYAGHMNGDLSMSAVLGYVLAQQYNQNNVAPEGGPLTSFIEYFVGQQLCEMLGYKITQPTEGSAGEDEVRAWGHITADGSIANLEAHANISYMIARNLKYYPLSLHQAMAPGAPLNFVADSFIANLCDGTQKNFWLCDPWDLLNLTPKEVADIPERLFAQYDISSDFLSKTLEPYSIQTVGKAKLDADFGITEPIQYFISAANHYSWPKGCAITGIGRDNIINVDVTYEAKMNTDELERLLNERLEDKKAVYCVVAVVGTTEHGSVDNVKEILRIRDDMAKKGMSFMVHVDAAWGGYFATKRTSRERGEPPPYAFSIPLNQWTNMQMQNLYLVDSITIDPHKSGFVPYPAGSLCLRDGRHRFLTTWTSPYINAEAGTDIAVGIYGVEGSKLEVSEDNRSKPGASAVAVLFSHENIGLLDGGYADLLGTTMLTGVKMYGLWSTISLHSRDLLVTPFRLLPIENQYFPDPAPADQLREQQEEIWNKVVVLPNDEIESDTTLVKSLTPDTIINAFACNFRLRDGSVNTDVVEANFLNRRIYQRLSVSTLKDELSDKPVLILQTEFNQSIYKGALEVFKNRMGLPPKSSENLIALSNVSMSPFPTAGSFIPDVFLPGFLGAAEEEIINCRVRTDDRPSIHGFVIQGASEELSLVYLPMFNIANQKQQVILSGSLPSDVMTTYLKEKEQNSDTVFTIFTAAGALSDLKTLPEILAENQFVGDIYRGLPGIYGSKSSPIATGVKFSITSVRFNNPLGTAAAQPTPNIQFLLYGTPESGYNIDHILSTGPNAQLTASGVALDVTPALNQNSEYTLTLDKRAEATMLPFTAQPSFFQPGFSAEVTVWEGKNSVAQGTMTLPANKGDLYFDCDFLNEEIAADIYITVPDNSETASDSWKTDIDGIADKLVEEFNAADKDKGIDWNDNVPHAIQRKYPTADIYSVTLGCPDTDLVKEGAYFSIVSRFVSNLPTNTRSRLLVLNNAYMKKFSVDI